jgi:hypothetical protein
MGKHLHTTLVIPDEERAQLQEMARKLGFLQTRGAGAGQLGSISALVRAIARGQLIESDYDAGAILLQISPKLET